MEKKIQTIRMFPEDAHKLKVWAAETDKKIGDVIQDLIQFIEQKAEERRKQFRKAGLSSYERHPTIHLALMSDDMVKKLIHAEADGSMDQLREELAEDAKEQDLETKLKQQEHKIEQRRRMAEKNKKNNESDSDE